MKKILSLALVLVLSFGMVTSSFADEYNQKDVTKTVKNGNIIQKTIKVNSLEEVNDFIEKSLITETPRGIKKRVKTYDDGTNLYVVAKDNDINDLSRSTTTSKSTTFYHYYDDFWGREQDAFKVKIDVDYVKDGYDGYIIKMTGTYTVYESDFDLDWDSDYTSSTPYQHGLGLDVRYQYVYDHFIVYQSNYNGSNESLTINQFVY